MKLVALMVVWFWAFAVAALVWVAAAIWSRL